MEVSNEDQLVQKRDHLVSNRDQSVSKLEYGGIEKVQIGIKKEPFRL